MASARPIRESVAPAAVCWIGGKPDPASRCSDHHAYRRGVATEIAAAILG